MLSDLTKFHQARDEMQFNLCNSNEDEESFSFCLRADHLKICSMDLLGNKFPSKGENADA